MLTRSMAALLAVLFLATPAVSAPKVPMPELVGISYWFNTDKPPTKDALRGHVVIVDFWTYSCVNCVRTLPHLKTWYARYHGVGLEIVGVHSPEFSFEKDPANVQKAVDALGVPYPVGMDNDHRTWNAYSNRFWPAEYVVDRDGNVRFQHFGEGHYDETEQQIRALLTEGRPNVTLPATAPVVSPSATPVTPEIYLGVARQSSFEGPTPKANEEQTFAAPPRLGPDHFAVQGRWRFAPEYVALASDEGTIELRFQANQADMVLDTDHGQETVAEIFIDGRPATVDNKGSDVTIESGKAVCRIRTARMYTLAQFPPGRPPSEHTLEVRLKGQGLRAYTFTFG